MPEGHTIHRHARLHTGHLAGKRVAAASPQGRFSAGAARLDGRRLDDVVADGKHLFYHWEGAETLHVHLGLIGRFRTFTSAPPAPTSGTRLSLVANGTTIYLSGPMICALLAPGEEETIRSRLGPDPLRRGTRVDAFAAKLAARKIPIGAALLDQAVVAGIGNVYRAELLFMCRIDPRIPARDLSDDAVANLWETTRRELRRGERSGRIVTVDPADVGAPSRRKLDRDERRYVYQREGLPCHRCGTEIRIGEVAQRKLWHCPSCQPPGAGKG
jgi:endonuclease-8